MVKYEDIIAAVKTRLNTNFSEITVNSNDIKEGFDRPSFFIKLDNVIAENFMQDTQDNYMTIRVAYFPEDKEINQEELLFMQDSLAEILLMDNVVTVNENISFEVEELEFAIVDDVLHCDFDITIYEEYNRTETASNMEAIEYKNEEGLIWQM